ncbi:MAG: uncharacterized protein QOD71_1519 [Thermoleophilaceae bacterium]|jgi:uncharacterized membrane protein (UPF0127 family)|nr:uncharacterized protein [Thermoleophilaceae bacterium]
MQILVAHSLWSRLLGLALRGRPPPGRALLLPRCRSVHTCGMRFALDLVWLARDGRVLAIEEGVRPWRVRSRRDAAAVLEVAAGYGARAAAALAFGRMPAMAELQPNRLAAALDPRQPIYRDTYNEYFVLVLSAGGAAAGTEVPLYILMAITGIWSVGVFVAACVVFELAVIFGLARPQMEPRERAGWAVLWGGTTAGLALAFYYLVAQPTL